MKRVDELAERRMDRVRAGIEAQLAEADRLEQLERGDGADPNDGVIDGTATHEP